MRRHGTNLILIGCIAALGFWIVEAAVDTLFFNAGSFRQKVLGPSLHETWMRLLVVAVILAYAIYARRVHATLEQRIAERTRELADLRREAERMAAEKERHRLAADLHDSVSQTLFSISLIADALPRLWEQDPDQARIQAEELSVLTRSALGEMRALLLELRPESLAGADPGDLLRHVVELIGDQGRLEIDARIDSACSPGPTINAALYRIAQEALNNVVRHSGAARARVRLSCRSDRVSLEVSDDGCGFDLATVPAEHLGLRLMRDRAAGSGATLEIDARAGEGTRVKAVWEGPTDPAPPAGATPR